MNNIIKRAVKLAISSCLAIGLYATADIAVIVHPSNNDLLDRNDIAHIFLAKTKAFPNGNAAEPIDQAEDALIRTAFNQHVLRKNPSKLRAYWAKLMFTGQGTPPKVVAGDDEVKSLVAANPTMIGYIEDSNVDDSVHVVYLF